MWNNDEIILNIWSVCFSYLKPAYLLVYIYCTKLVSSGVNQKDNWNFSQGYDTLHSPIYCMVTGVWGLDPLNCNWFLYSNYFCFYSCNHLRWWWRCLYCSYSTVEKEKDRHNPSSVNTMVHILLFWVYILVLMICQQLQKIFDAINPLKGHRCSIKQFYHQSLIWQQATVIVTFARQLWIRL